MSSQVALTNTSSAASEVPAAPVHELGQFQLEGLAPGDRVGGGAVADEVTQRVGAGAGEVQLVAHTGNASEEQPTLKQESWNLEKGDALAAEVASFVESILENKPCEVSGHDGVAALELAEEIIADIERRKF